MIVMFNEWFGWFQTLKNSSNSGFSFGTNGDLFGLLTKYTEAIS